MKAHGLEQRAHLRLTGEAIKLSCDLLGAIGASGRQGLRAGLDTQHRQEHGLAQDRPGLSARLDTGGQHGGKIGPDGQVGLAGAFQRIDLPVALDRLQRIARPWRVAAIVDQQRRAAVDGEAVADLGAERFLGG